jgi:hypothetical protein
VRCGFGVGGGIGHAGAIPSPDAAVIHCDRNATAESVRALNACYGSGRTLNVTGTRDLYNCLLAGENWQRVQTKYAAADVCERAQSLHAYRHAVRLYTRTRGPFAAQLFAQARDFFVYRNSEGPLFAALLAKSRGNCSNVIKMQTAPMLSTTRSAPRLAHVTYNSLDSALSFSLPPSSFADNKGTFQCHRSSGVVFFFVFFFALPHFSCLRRAVVVATAR